LKKLLVITLLIYFNVIAFPQSVTFMAIGDWGREGKYLQQETADQMGIYADKNSPDFIISLGDNIYNAGVTNTTDPKWQTCFENIYTASSLQIPWYAALGNHDYGGNVQAQIDYSEISSRWKMPSRYFAFEKKIDETFSVLFVIIDTSPFIESYKKKEKENTELNDNSFKDINKQDTKVQLTWLDSVLSSSKAKWKITAGHHPIYTGGEHGNTIELIEQLKPILEKNNVNMYMAGHDHDMQHLKVPSSVLNYFISGAGSKVRKTGKMEYSLFSHSENGFLYVNVSTAEINCKFISVNGDNLYEYVIK